MLVLIAFLLTLIGSALLVDSALNRRPAIFSFSIIFWLGHILPMWSLAGLGFLEYEQLTFGRFETVGPVTLMILLSSLGLWYGYYVLAVGAKSAPFTGGPRPNSRTASSHLLAAKALNLFWVSVVVLAMATHPDGVLGFLSATFSRAINANWVSSVIYAVLVVLAVTTAYELILRLRNGMRPNYGFLLFTATGFWLLGGRLQFFITLASFAMIFLKYRKLSLQGTALYGLFALIPLNGILLLRLQQQGREISIGEAFATTFQQLSMIDSYDLAVQYVERFGHETTLYFNLPLRLLPRLFYEDKPDQISLVFRRTFFGDELGGIPPALFGEFYLIGGIIGSLIGGVLFGASLRWLDNSYKKLRAKRIEVQAATVMLIPTVAFYVPRGGLDTAIFRLFLVGFAFVVLSLIPMLFSRRIPATAGSRLATRE